MQPVSQGVTALDLQKIRQQNEDSLQSRATQQLGAQLRTAANKVVSEEEKQTAGQGDQVDIKSDSKKAKSVPPQAQASEASKSSQSSESKSEDTSASSSESKSESKSEDSQTTQPGKIEYSEQQKAFLERLKELEQQAKSLRDMWRKMYMDWMEDQLKAAEDWENFRQSTAMMWNEVAVSRWVQGTRHAEAVRGLL